MEFLFQILIFAVMAIVGAAVNGDKNAEKAEKFDVKGLLNSAKEAFQDADVPGPKERAVPLADISFPPADEDKEKDEFELTVGGSTLKFEVPDPADDGRDGERHYFSADETGEGHVASVGLSRERQLEQLETWREAGLIDEDEYKERKRKIKRG